MKTKVNTYIKRADEIQEGDRILIVKHGVVGQVQSVYLTDHTITVNCDNPPSVISLPNVIFGCDEMVMTIEI